MCLCAYPADEPFIYQTKPRAAKNALVVRKLPGVYQKLRIHLCNKNVEGYREFAKILLLNLEFKFEDVLSAVEEGLKQHSPTEESIRQILTSQVLSPTISIKDQSQSPLINLDVPVDTPSKFDHLMGGLFHDGAA